MAWYPIRDSYDTVGSTLIPKLALSEMKAKPDEDQNTKRDLRIALMARGEELVVGKALNARSAMASHHVPPMTVRRFPRIVFDPSPPYKALTYAGGGEASALAAIAELKRHGRVSMVPDYDNPARVLEAVTMDEVHQAGDPNYNRFRGFHGDHAYAAFHPSDTSSRGVYEPDMTLPSDLVQACAQGYRTAGGAMLLPTVAVFFVIGKDVTKEAYVAGARAIQNHCVGLAPYLSAAAKWHREKTAGQFTKQSVNTMTKTLSSVVEAVRKAKTFASLVKKVDKIADENVEEEGNKRAAATVLKLAATYYPDVLRWYGDMIEEFTDWRKEQDEGRTKPQFFFDEVRGAGQLALRRAATLTICGYIFLPDSTDIGVTGVFQMSGSSRAEGIRYGEFAVLPMTDEGFKLGVLNVRNDLDNGFIGYRVRGHAAHTLKMAHRIILQDAIQTAFGGEAKWAEPEAARAWLARPEETWTVQSCSARQLVLQRDDTWDELTLDMAVHSCASSGNGSGTVVPLVFSPINDIVFERFTRCPRSATGTERELHGAQLLQEGDKVTVWTTPSADDPARKCLVAARCWNLECALIPEVAGVTGLAFDIVDEGTKEMPTPLEVITATFAFSVVHRQPSTVVPYLYSPTKTGDETLQGQGVGKTQWLRRSLAAVGPNLVDVVNDHDRLVKTDQFNDKGYAALFTIIDDIENPSFLMQQSTKAGATAAENEARVKSKGNKKGDNYNTTCCTGNKWVATDEVGKKDAEKERRMQLSRAWSTHVGCVEYFKYIYGTYFAVNPIILFGILEYWRTLPDILTCGPGDLQDMVKRARVHWSGQVPMHVGFLQKLYEAPRMKTADIDAERKSAVRASKGFTLMDGVDEGDKHVTEKEFFAAAKQYVQENFDTGGRNPQRVRENAQHIIAALKKAAEEGGAVWSKLYHSAQAPVGTGTTEQKKQMCFSVVKAVLKSVVEACGYRVYDTAVSEDAPTWPSPVQTDDEPESGYA